MKTKGLFKKAAAVTLGVSMAFGALMLPDVITAGQFCSASAETVTAGDCTYDYTLKKDNTLEINSVEFSGDSVEIPQTLIIEGTEYPVTSIGTSFLAENESIRRVVFPDSVKTISTEVLSLSSVEDIVLPDTLEALGSRFASKCPNLKSVKYNGTNIKPGNMGIEILSNSQLSGVTNEKGAVVFGNWLITYKPTDDVTTIRPTDLGNNGIKVEYLNRSSICELENVDCIDLEDIKYVGDYSVFCCESLMNVINSGSVEYVGTAAFLGSPWYQLMKKSYLTRLGSVLMHYNSDSTVIDLTLGELEGVKQLYKGSLADCKNAETLISTSDIKFDSESFYDFGKDETKTEEYKYLLPLPCSHKIKKVILDGEELTYSRIIEDPAKSQWVRSNFFALKDSVFMDTLITDKVRKLFDQLDITYCGGGVEKPKYSATEEFYIRLKIHNYISIYDYDHKGVYANEMTAFLLNGECYCASYAGLTLFLSECAGIRGQSLIGNSHEWNNTRIGDEWFESDDGWNAQNNNHSFSWFGMSSQKIYERDNVYHKFNSVCDPSFRFLLQEPYTEHMIGTRTIGDIDGDADRDNDDVALLWNYIEGKSKSIYQKGADVNFDGKIDVTDAVLLDDFVNSKAVDPNNVPCDGFAPNVKVAFLNGRNYDDIKYLYTDREGYITLPDDLFYAPAGAKISYDIGRAGQKVRITDPLTVVKVKWVDKNAPEYDLGDVNGDGTIDIEDAVAVIQHINGITPLTDEQEERADVSKDKNIDIDDAVTLISFVNGNTVL